MKRVIISILIIMVTLIGNSHAQIIKNSAMKFGGVVAFQVRNNAPRLGISVSFGKDIFYWDKFTISSELSYIQ